LSAFAREYIPALTDGDDITLLDTNEGGGQVGGDVSVSLLVSAVLADIVKVVTTDDDGSLHLVGDNDTTEDTAADRNTTSEGALLVDVVALNSSLGGLEAKTDGADVTHTTSLGGLKSYNQQRQKKREKKREKNKEQLLHTRAPTFLDLITEMPSCFWKAFSVCRTANEKKEERGQFFWSLTRFNILPSPPINNHIANNRNNLHGKGTRGMRLGLVCLRFKVDR
jgi:hypothetical protein